MSYYYVFGERGVGKKCRTSSVPFETADIQAAVGVMKARLPTQAILPYLAELPALENTWKTYAGVVWREN